MMNNFKHIAEEIVVKEIICTPIQTLSSNEFLLPRLKIRILGLVPNPLIKMKKIN